MSTPPPNPYNRGYNEGYGGGHISANPFPDRSNDSEAWDDGFFDGKRERDEQRREVRDYEEDA